MNPDRLMQTYDIFWDDYSRSLKSNFPIPHENSDVNQVKTLDQFKTSAYLCFWLRRVNPVSEIRPVGWSLLEQETWLKGDENLPKNVENFILYGNEIAAFVIAIRLSQYLSAVEFQASPKLVSLDSKRVSNKSTLSSREEWNEFIGEEEILEFAKILKHKNMSPHSLNMTLKMMAQVGLRGGFSFTLHT